MKVFYWVKLYYEIRLTRDLNDVSVFGNMQIGRAYV